MKTATLTRLDTSDQGTFGRIQAGDLILFTGELPWRDNQANISCIPEGSYICRYTFSPRFRRGMYVLEQVPARAGVRKHSANLMGDAGKGFRAQLNGCIALGEKLGWIEGQKALLISAPAMRRFEDYMERKPFKLEVVRGYP